MAEYVGILRPFERGGIVETGDPSIGDIWISEQNLNGAPFGMKVVCESEPPLPQRMGVGRIIEVLGDPSLPNVAIQGIIRSYGLSEKFPPEVLEQAEGLPAVISQEEISAEIQNGRKDLRTLRTLTIDGLDAKDLDDAISIEKLSNGLTRLYVHIADVTHYVQEGSPIDVEAAERGTSVYLVDRVLPMQPPALSNGICSLNPHQDRFTLTVTIDYDQAGEIVGHEIFESIINSDVRGNYEDVRTMIETGKPVSPYGKVFDDLMEMYRLSRILRRKRMERGAINFDFPETEVELDAEGKPVRIYPHPVSEANELIEEFMIAANIVVATTFCNKEAPFIYRVHELPKEEKLDQLFSLAQRMGVSFKRPREITPAALSDFLEKAKEHPFSNVLSQLLLEAQAKARYDSKCLGHFGLALTYYCHFTSPIRRYPDSFIHRVIKGYLHGAPKIKHWKAIAQDRADHSSEMERTAMMAERDTVDQKVAEYMADHLGDEFEGIISGMAFSGMFVRLDNSAEGMIPFRDMGDYYVFSKEQMLVQGSETHRVFRIGTRVRVKVARSDVIKRQVDFSLVDEEKSGTVEKNHIDYEESMRIQQDMQLHREARSQARSERPLSMRDVESFQYIDDKGCVRRKKLKPKAVKKGGRKKIKRRRR